MRLKPSQIILIAITLRVAAWLFISPSDDTARYAWEGAMFKLGENPYTSAPETLSQHHAHADYYSEINHKTLTAIYPPLSMGLFRAAAQIPVSPEGFKVIFGIIDLLNVALLILICQKLGRRIEHVLYYAANPLILIAFAGEGHLDTFMIFFILLALLAYLHQKLKSMWCFLAFAVQAKYAALFLFPFLWNRKTWKSSGLFIILNLAIMLPFIQSGLFESLSHFTTTMHFNAPLFELLWRNGMSVEQTSRLLMLFLIAGLALIRLLNNHVFEASLYGLTLLLFCASNIHYWYLSWLIPFAVIVPNKWVLLWSLTIGVNFFTIQYHHETGLWKQSSLLLFLEYLPVMAMITWEFFARNNRKTMYDDTKCTYEKIAIVIPVLNEKEALSMLLESLQQQTTAAHEIIIADASDSDELYGLSQKHHATLLKSPKGRGNQIHHAIASSTADIFLILHSDSIPPPNLLMQIQKRMRKTGRLMGSCGCRFKGSRRGLLNSANHFRADIGGISFGDQGQFIHRKLLDKLGGFPQLPLMEDVELSLSAKEIEHPLYLNTSISASSRSWDTSDTSKRAHLIIYLVGTFLFKRFVKGTAPEGEWFYQKYYNPPSEKN